jgi:hypothetical protein
LVEEANELFAPVIKDAFQVRPYQEAVHERAAIHRVGDVVGGEGHAVLLAEAVLVVQKRMRKWSDGGVIASRLPGSEKQGKSSSGVQLSYSSRWRWKGLMW